MTSKRIRLIALAVLAASLLAGFARAQGSVVSSGRFTLPVETHWGLAVLPPGEYTYKLASSGFPAIVTVRGQGRAVMIMTNAGISDHRVSDRSVLNIIRIGREATVRSLDLGHLGRTFNYRVPKHVAELMAQKPELLQHVSVEAVQK